MKKTNNLVSIVLPVYNADEHLETALESLTAQTHKTLEIIAVDDHSRDNSIAILRRFQKKDKRIRIYRNVKHYGPTISFNRAFKRAQGNFIAFMHPKDKISRQRIKKQFSFLLKNPKVAAVGTQCVYIDAENKKIEKSLFPTSHNSIIQKVLTGFSIQFETLMINRNALPKDILGFRGKSMHHLYTDFLMKIQQYGEVANLSETLHYRRSIPFAAQDTITKIASLPQRAKLFLKMIAEYDNRPSLRSLLRPF